jgi:hypothetical protein
LRKKGFKILIVISLKDKKMIVSGRIAFSGDKNYAIEKESSLVLTIDFCSQMKILRDILQNDIQRIKNVCITVYFLYLVGFKPKIKLFHGIFSFFFLSSNPALKISLNYIFSDGVSEVLLCVYFYLNIF